MNHLIFITNKLNYLCKRKSKIILQLPQLLLLHLHLSLKYDDEGKLKHQLKWERLEKILKTQKKKQIGGKVANLYKAILDKCNTIFES